MKEGGLLFIMSPLIVQAGDPRKRTCSVSRTGISLSQPIIDQTKWNIGDKIEIGFIRKVSCILLRKTTEASNCFRLTYLNNRTKTGGKIHCVAWCRNYLSAITVLPKRNLCPIFLRTTQWDLALLLEEINWEFEEEFSKAGLEKMKQHVNKEAVGCYVLLGARDKILRYGQGQLVDRLKAHLNDVERFMPLTKKFRAIVFDCKEDAEIFEKVLIAQYELETGMIPPFNEIRS